MTGLFECISTKIIFGLSVPLLRHQMSLKLAVDEYLQRA